MPRNNPNASEREAAKALAADRGVSYQSAIQLLRAGSNTPASSAISTMANRSARDVAAVKKTIDTAAIGRVEDMLVDLFARGSTFSVDEFTPLDLVEGHIEECLLVAFAPEPGSASVVDAERMPPPASPQRWGVHWLIEGTGDVDWCVNAPSASDVAFYGDSLGGDSGGPGMVQEVEMAVPIRLHVWAAWSPDSGQWTDLEIQFIDMPRQEVQDRNRRHDGQETRRLQAYGLLPSDDWIAEQAYTPGD
jgi:hypothetical protein